MYTGVKFDAGLIVSWPHFAVLLVVGFYRLFCMGIVGLCSSAAFDLLSLG